MRGVADRRARSGALELTPASGHSNQNSYANGDCKCNKGTILGLSDNSAQRIAADCCTDFDDLVAEIGRLIDSYASATTEAIYDFV